MENDKKDTNKGTLTKLGTEGEEAVMKKIFKV